MNKKANNFVNGETSVIGAGSVFEGNLKTNATIRVDGEIIGDIDSLGTVIIGVEGKIRGNIKTVDLLVAGNVIGDVTASNKIEIVAKGKLDGDISTKGLVIDETAIFQGKCIMSSEIQNNEINKDTDTKNTETKNTK